VIKSFIKLINQNNRIFILPTKLGFYFLAITFVLFTFSLSYGNPLAYTATFFFTATIVASTIYTNYNLSGVKANIKSSYSGFYANETNALNINLSNISKKVRFDLKIDLLKKKSTRPISLIALDNKDVKVLLPKLERGVYRIKTLSISSSFPFGLFYAWTNIKLDHSIYIFPEPIGEKEKNLIDDERQGETTSNQLEGNDDFYQHKNYSEGESWKRINWQVWAKINDLLIKQYQATGSKKYIFDINDFKSSNIEESLNQLSKWVKEAIQEKSSFTLRLDSKKGEVYNNKDQYQKALILLASHNKKEILI
jgi:uncharacterized protein (DUF58 family)